MQVVTYELKKIKRIVDIISHISFSGFDTARQIAEIGDILDSGIPGTISEEKKEEEVNAVDRKKIQSD